MTRSRFEASPPPSLAATYAELMNPPRGHDVHAEYRRRWLAWHAEQCGRTSCDAHVDPHNIVQKIR